MSSIGPNKVTHEIFKPIFEESELGVAYIGEILRKHCGCIVDVPPKKLADKVQDRMKCSDSGDMFVQHDKLPGRVVIEGKHLGYNFTCGMWPHGDRYLVTTVHSYEKRIVKPWSYISLNRHATHWGVVLCSTFEHWEKGYYEKDKNYPGHKLPQWKYYIHKSLVQFWKIPDHFIRRREEFFGKQDWIV